MTLSECLSASSLIRRSASESRRLRVTGSGVAGVGDVAEGWTPEEIVDNFPGIVVDDVQACVGYGARLADLVQLGD